MQLDSAINIDSANPVATRFNVQNKGELNSVKAQTRLSDDSVM